MLHPAWRDMPEPARPEFDRVAGVASNRQRVGRITQVENFQLVKNQRIVTAASDVNRLDADQFVVGDCRQVKCQVTTVECQVVRSASPSIRANVESLIVIVSSPSPV